VRCPVHLGLHTGVTNRMECAVPYRTDKTTDGNEPRGLQLDEDSFANPEDLEGFQDIEGVADFSGGDHAVQF